MFNYSAFILNSLVSFQILSSTDSLSASNFVAKLETVVDNVYNLIHVATREAPVRGSSD